MRLSLFSISRFFFLGLLACGGSSVSIDVDVAVNSNDPMTQIAVDKQNGESRGIYFQFDPLNCPPASINDVNSSLLSLTFPDFSQAGVEGVDPLKSEFEIDTSGLSSNVYYRMTMFALTPANVQTHIGISDCPLRLDLKGQNQVQICFGESSINPICAGHTAFKDCPALSCS